MKRFFLLALTLCLALLAACGGPGIDPNVYQAERNGTVYTVDQNAGTITFDGHVCTFTVNGNQFEVTYPDGSNWYWTRQDNIGYGGWSDDYDEDRYAPGETLYDLLDRDTSRRDRQGHPLLGLLLMALGVMDMVYPRGFWYMSYGWRYKDAEPSEAALLAQRFSGLAALVIGLILMFI